uniref:EF-hand domain-containing protein n=1 Tax=Timema shepardi TaxID=629360 RepID=A0A7R9AZ09_TIMSH|nr:unnamed protein product [Timema shepardi]
MDPTAGAINICTKEFQEAFQLFDSRGDGKIHVTQIGDVLRALGQNPTESDVKKFTHQHKPVYRLGVTRMDRVSHVPYMTVYRLGVTRMDRVIQARRDKDGQDERISFEVFLPIYQAISKGRTSDTADDFIEGLRHFDKDGNGFISSAELRHLLSTLGSQLARPCSKLVGSGPNHSCLSSALIWFLLRLNPTSTRLLRSRDTPLCGESKIRVGEAKRNLLGEKLTDEEVEQLLAGQEDSQGNINYEEFVRMVMCG